MESVPVMDRNFDTLYERLQNRIYNSPKGRLRIELLWEDLSPFVSNNEKRTLTVLDAGGGMGQLSLMLAEAGHKIVLCDISEKMLNAAKEKFNEAGLDSNLELIHTAFQDLPDDFIGRFDLVLSHAVLEWLESPEQSFKSLVRYVKPGGMLSLMFYNLNSLICQNAIKGNFVKLMNEEFAGQPNGLTPMNPLPAETVESWFPLNNLSIMSKTGIRVFYDLMFRKTRDLRAYEDILEVEKKYCRKEPYASMGRYVHLLGITNT